MACNQRKCEKIESISVECRLKRLFTEVHSTSVYIRRWLHNYRLRSNTLKNRLRRKLMKKTKFYLVSVQVEKGLIYFNQSMKKRIWVTKTGQRKWFVYNGHDLQPKSNINVTATSSKPKRLENNIALQYCFISEWPHRNEGISSLSRSDQKILSMQCFIIAYDAIISVVQNHLKRGCTNVSLMENPLAELIDNTRPMQP